MASPTRVITSSSCIIGINLPLAVATSVLFEKISHDMFAKFNSCAFSAFDNLMIHTVHVHPFI